MFPIELAVRRFQGSRDRCFDSMRVQGGIRSIESGWRLDLQPQLIMRIATHVEIGGSCAFGCEADADPVALKRLLAEANSAML